MNKQSEAQAKYDAKATRRFALKLNLKSDADIIEKLESVESMQGFIKEAIRAYISKGEDQ